MRSRGRRPRFAARLHQRRPVSSHWVRASGLRCWPSRPRGAAMRAPIAHRGRSPTVASPSGPISLERWQSSAKSPTPTCTATPSTSSTLWSAGVVAVPIRPARDFSRSRASPSSAHRVRGNRPSCVIGSWARHAVPPTTAAGCPRQCCAGWRCRRGTPGPRRRPAGEVRVRAATGTWVTGHDGAAPPCAGWQASLV